MSGVKTYIRDSALEYYRGWIIKQIRTPGLYTRCLGYMARKPKTDFILGCKNYRNIRFMINSMNGHAKFASSESEKYEKVRSPVHNDL